MHFTRKHHINSETTVEAKVFEYVNSQETDKGLLARFLEIAQADRELLDSAIAAIEGDRGFTTPDEAFVHSILTLYSLNSLEPDRICDALREFAANLQDATDAAQNLFRRHPARIKAVIPSR